MSEARAIGIDLGGTRLRVALVDGAGQIHARAACNTDSGGGPAAVQAQMLELIAEVRRGHPAVEVVAAGICAPGPLDSTTGTVLSVPTLTGWLDVPIAAILAERLGVPVVLENDGIAAANGEWLFGAGVGLQNLIYVTVSTGIGGGVVMDGRLLHGRRGMAAHVGHMILDPGGPRCCCGAHGCFEALASGSALGLAGRAAALDAGVGALSKVPADSITAETVVTAARQGDAAAIQLIDTFAVRLGLGFASLIHLFSPDRLIMGGGVSQAFDLLGPRIREAAVATLMPPFRDVTIVPATLGDNAGLVGVAAMALARRHGGQPAGNSMPGRPG